MAYVKVKSRRQLGVHVVKPFMYGSAAFWQGRSAEEKRTHRWTIFVRGLENEDMSYFIKSVTFQLHPSFENPVRVVEQPPFEVTEHGWGEFGVGIKINFHDSREQPVTLQHMLKLFPANKADETTKVPVMAEHYDEFVFAEPTETFCKQLNSGPPRKFDKHPLNQWFDESLGRMRAQEEQQWEMLGKAQAQVNRSLEALREKLHDIQVEAAHYRSVT